MNTSAPSQQHAAVHSPSHPIVVCALYHFARFDDFRNFRTIVRYRNDHQLLSTNIYYHLVSEIYYFFMVKSRETSVEIP